MKFKKSLFFFILFLILGSVCLLVAHEKYNMSIKNSFKNYELKTITYTENESILNLKIDTRTQGIQFLKSENNELKIDYYQHNRAKWTFELNENTLTIQEKFQMIDIFFFRGYNQQPMKIYLPNLVLDQCEIKVLNGEVKSSLELQTKKFSLDIKNGRIELSNLKAMQMNMKMTNGQIKLNHITCEDLLEIKQTNGQLILNSSIADKVKINLTNGEINLKQIEANHFDLDLVNGDILGTIKGNQNDYVIECNVTNGKIVSPKNQRNESLKTFYANVTNGKIKVYFENN